MTDSLNNKELIAVGHEFARTLSSDTPIIDMAKMFTRLAERLDCTTAALREMKKQRDALAAENAGLKEAAEFATASDMWEELGGNVMRYQYQEWYADKLKSAMNTPATDSFLAEVRAQGVERLANAWYAIANETDPGISISDSSRLKYRQRADDAADFANDIRQEAAQ